MQYVLAELHEGVCDNHIGGRTVLTHRDIIGLPCDKAPRIMPKDVIGAKGMLPYLTCPMRPSIQSQTLGYSHNGKWT